VFAEKYHDERMAMHWGTTGRHESRNCLFETLRAHKPVPKITRNKLRQLAQFCRRLTVPFSVIGATSRRSGFPAAHAPLAPVTVHKLVVL
jgi:hypothetical protein